MAKNEISAEGTKGGFCNSSNGVRCERVFGGKEEGEVSLSCFACGREMSLEDGSSNFVNRSNGWYREEGAVDEFGDGDCGDEVRFG